MLIGEIVYLEYQQMVVDQIVIEMLDFDIILGMDFLSRYKAKINYQKKQVQFSLDSKEQFTFRKCEVFNMMINSVKA